MAIISRSFAAASLLISLMLLNLITDSHQVIAINAHGSGSVAAPAPAPSPVGIPTTDIDCTAACDGRCKESKRPHLCMRACGTCCHRCNCVPPGTYGNYEACPCYFNLKTHHQARKCP